jgi:hypothetical protein
VCISSITVSSSYRYIWVSFGVGVMYGRDAEALSVEWHRLSNRGVIALFLLVV